MTPAQLKLLHIAVRDRGYNDDQYRVLLRNTGKVESGKDLTNEGFEDVMAVLEGRGFQADGKPADYWRNKVQLRGRFGGERMTHLIMNLAARTRYASGVAGLCMRFSHGRTDKVDKLAPGEAHALAEMLKNVIARSEGAAARTGGELQLVRTEKVKPLQPNLFPNAPDAPARVGFPDVAPNKQLVPAGAFPAETPGPAPEPNLPTRSHRTPSGSNNREYLTDEDIPF